MGIDSFGSRLGDRIGLLSALAVVVAIVAVAFVASPLIAVADITGEVSPLSDHVRWNLLTQTKETMARKTIAHAHVTTKTAPRREGEENSEEEEGDEAELVRALSFVSTSSLFALGEIHQYW
jgi:hypothetical protein